jgi:hypothetical protein
MGKYPSGIKTIPVGGIGLDWLYADVEGESMRKRRKKLRNFIGFFFRFSFMEF